MCIAIAKPKGLEISKEALAQSWASNPHGAGYAFRNGDGNIIVRKFMDFKTFYNEFSVVESKFRDHSDFLIHFRITSRGATRIDNCHPFLINNQMAFIHNGTITSMPEDKEHHHSDTYLFNELILKHLPEDWEDNIGIKLLIEEMIGWSKIALLHAEKGIYLFNEEKGLWDDGIWYSNSSYKPITKYYCYKSEKKAYDFDDTGEDDLLLSYQNRHFESNQADNKEKEEEEHEGEVTYIDDENNAETVLECEECGNWVSIEDIYTASNPLGGVTFMCEECVTQYEEFQIPLTMITLDEASFQEEIEARCHAI